MEYSLKMYSTSSKIFLKITYITKRSRKGKPRQDKTGLVILELTQFWIQILYFNDMDNDMEGRLVIFIHPLVRTWRQ